MHLWENFYQNGKLSWKGNFNDDIYTGYFEWHPIIINVHNQIDKIKFVSSLKSPENLDLVIDETVEKIMSAPISDKAKARIKASVLGGNAPSYYTQLYQSHMSKQTEETRSILSNRLENLFGALFQMGEIQLF